MENSKIVLFDGVCNLCNSSVQFIIERDNENQFKFASLQSEFGQEFLRKNYLNTEKFDSIILVENEKYFTESSAAIKIGQELKGMKWTKILWIFPKFIRDFVYKIISRNRYKWFGKKDNCWLPTPDLKAKFLDS
jgi:predicted DCC family thiol-disulfide oxidoreductase YuxK